MDEAARYSELTRRRVGCVTRCRIQRLDLDEPGTGIAEFVQYLFYQRGTDALVAAGGRCCRPKDFGRLRPMALDDDEPADDAAVRDDP